MVSDGLSSGDVPNGRSGIYGRRVFLAGVDVPDRTILDLARRLRDADHVTLADKLEAAWRSDDSTIALETADREALLAILGDPPAGLARLQAVLIQEHERKLGGGH